MFRIGEFSNLGKVSVKTIRYYDEVGLLKPALVDTETNYRYYTEDQLAQLRQILMYKEAGLQIDEIAMLLKCDAACRNDILLSRRRELLALKDTIENQLQHLDVLLSHEPKNEYTASVKQIDACGVFYCRGYVVSLEDIRSFMRRAHCELRRTNPEIRFPQPDYCCVIYPQESYRETNIFIEYAQSVETCGVDSAAIKFKQLDAITAVCVEHRGNYSGLRDAYLFAVNWAMEHGYEINCNVRERYINGSWNCEHEKDWLTEIQLPIKINTIFTSGGG